MANDSFFFHGCRFVHGGPGVDEGDRMITSDAARLGSHPRPGEGAGLPGPSTRPRGDGLPAGPGMRPGEGDGLHGPGARLGEVASLTGPHQPLQLPHARPVALETGMETLATVMEIAAGTVVDPVVADDHVVIMIDTIDTGVGGHLELPSTPKEKQSPSLVVS